MATLKAVVVKADGAVSLVDIENHFEAFQKVVGGYIEGVFQNDITIYVNEEGLFHGLPPNGRIAEVMDSPRILVGDALIVGAADEEGNDTDVPTYIIEHYGLEK